MLVRVPTVKTNFNVADFIKALIYTWYDMYNELPTKAQLGVIYAQWGLETGVGSFCWCNNIGNVKAVDSPGETVKYCVLNGTWEIINGKKVVLSPEDPGSWFRAFPTLKEGLEYHIHFLRNKRYKIAWTAVEQGNHALFAHLLKKQGYYTAPEQDYVNAMQYHFGVFMRGPTFAKMIEEFKQEQFQIEFPKPYEPLEFDVKEDVVERKLKVSTPKFLSKLKTLFKL